MQWSPQMEKNDKNGVDLTHDEIAGILIAAVEQKFPTLAADRHPEIRFYITDDGLEAEVFFTSYN